MQRAPSPKEETMSITMTVLYPNEEGSKFDWDYYMNSHMKLVAERLAGPE